MTATHPHDDDAGDGDLAKQFGELLTAARGDRSRRELAAELGLSNTTLLSLELGRGNPTLDRVEKMAAAYGIDVDLVATPLRPGELDQ